MKNYTLHPLTRQLRTAIKPTPLLLMLMATSLQAQEAGSGSNDSELPEEVEVIEISYGYSAVEKKDLTGAIATVDIEDVIDLPDCLGSLHIVKRLS